MINNFLSQTDITALDIDYKVSTKGQVQAFSGN